MIILNGMELAVIYQSVMEPAYMVTVLDPITVPVSIILNGLAHRVIYLSAM